MWIFFLISKANFQWKEAHAVLLTAGLAPGCLNRPPKHLTVFDCVLEEKKRV